MIIYNETKDGFMHDFERGILIEKLDKILAQRYRRSAPGEMNAWTNSLSYMYMVLNTADIPVNAGVAIEYLIPTTAKRIDFLISGYDEKKQANTVIVELKQWSDALPVEGKDNVVSTYVGGGMREVAHPSYQAWSYAQLISDYNSAVEKEKIALHPCCYLHNYSPIDPPYDPLRDESFKFLLDEAPLFDKQDTFKLRAFISRFVHYGDDQDILYRIENGEIKPSKSLQDKLTSMLKGNPEFTMIDDQKVVYETAISLAERSRYDDEKYVYIIEGGPGTGKSVVAVNLLCELTRRDMTVHYVTKNEAPRKVYNYKLQGSSLPSSVNNLFKSSASYMKLDENTMDVLIVDEAHRLNEHSGFYGNLGENQILEIIRAARTSFFFIDEAQIVTTKDIGRIKTIENFAKQENAHLLLGKLQSQFRCNGSEGYLAWIDDVLEIRETANYLFDIDFDIDIVDDPNDIMDWLREKNEINNKARMLAGYCWKWPTKSRSNTNFKDIQIPDKNFEMAWNLDNYIWAIDPQSIEEAGCIHTTQGLEFDYIGVIIGPDMRYENGKIVTDIYERATTDNSTKGLKTLMKADPDAAYAKGDEIIKNTYRTLMTRGMKGCRIYCVDEALGLYLQDRIANNPLSQALA